MSISKSIREQLLNSFRSELAEHIQTMNDGLLAMEQGKLAAEERQSTLDEIFRAAHSLKGAARSVGATAIEQLAHKLEGILDGLRNDTIISSPELFNTCYLSFDAIQSVHAAYEAGEITPPTEALKALIALEELQPNTSEAPPAQRWAKKTQSQIETDVDNDSTAGMSFLKNISPLIPNPEEADLTAKVETHPSEDGHQPGASVPTLLEAVESPSPISSELGADIGGSLAKNETIRIGVNKLDALMTHLSELLVAKIRAEERLERAQELQELMVLWQRDWFSVRSAYGRALRQDLSGTLRRLGPVERGNGASDEDRIMGKDIQRLFDYIETSRKRLREVGTRVNELVREYDSDTTHMSLVIDELGEEIKRVNMLPLSTIIAPFGRMVRDLSQAAGKEVVLKIVGDNTEIDKRVLEKIKDPLIHLLRNAVDHGIEPPGIRKEQGKSPDGLITLSAKQLGKDVIISVSDDGAGLNLDAIRNAIKKQGRADGEALSDRELEEAIFTMGVSSSQIITDISGRGVGLDVVLRNVEMLHGSIDLDWSPNQGSTFTMTLPLRLTSSRGLLVRVTDQTFAIPINTIDRIIPISQKEIVHLEGYKAILHNGHPITLVLMSDVLDLPLLATSSNGTSIPVIVLNVGNRHMAFIVDELIGEQEIVVKGLGNQLARVNGIVGCTIMGSGEVVLILNAADLMKIASQHGVRSSFNVVMESADTPVELNTQPRLLVVDDSITTRTLEKTILEAAGYSVELATNGQEALEAIKIHGAPDLMVVDVIMPLMNGFELTKQVKSDPNLDHVPIILVTSLDSREDKEHGIEIGADAYIVKSSFNQKNLLETIEQLI